MVGAPVLILKNGEPVAMGAAIAIEAGDVLKIRPASECQWDCAAFGEVMLRFDPGHGRRQRTR